MEDYEYHFFYSYKRNDRTKLWHEEVKGTLEHYVRMELNIPKVNIFFDQDDIKSGDRWKSVIKDALKKSRCLVPFLSPDYFHSRWCYSEYRAFVERSASYKLDNMIVPVKYFDGESYQKEIEDINFVDFNKYNNPRPAFWNTTKAVDFDDELQHFAKDIAAKIKAAPPYQSEFEPVLLEHGRPVKRIGRPV